MATIAASSGSRRPRWSETGPPTSWPRAMPTKNVVKVSCTCVAVADRSAATRGNAGTYMSVASGAIAVKNITVASTAAPTCAPVDAELGTVLGYRGGRVRVIAEVLAVGAVPQVVESGTCVGHSCNITLVSLLHDVERSHLLCPDNRFRREEGVSAEGCTDRASHRPARSSYRRGMDNRAEVREFLISRRAKISPAEAGLPEVGARRVPGLRRGEVAALAGVSVEYYAKLERGAIAGVSASVLDAIARALRLDDAERAHLFHLAHAADGTSAGMRPRRRPASTGHRDPACSGCSTRFTAPGHRPQRPDGPAGHQPARSRHARRRLRDRPRAGLCRTSSGTPS